MLKSKQNFSEYAEVVKVHVKVIWSECLSNTNITRFGAVVRQTANKTELGEKYAEIAEANGTDSGWRWWQE